MVTTGVFLQSKTHTKTQKCLSRTRIYMLLPTRAELVPQAAQLES